MDLLFTYEGAFSFVTLSLLEIVLGVDNLIFISLCVNNLPAVYRKKARLIGLTLALLIRVAMLFGLAWVMQLTQPLFTFLDTDISVKDLLMLAGGGFLIAKSTFEMHADMAGAEEKKEIAVASGFTAAVLQIALIDFVFSFDSIITAIGITTHVIIIIPAIFVSMLVMLYASGVISTFLERYPTFKILALSFILMIGTMLMADGLHFHIPRGYIYFSFAFSTFVELLNLLASHRRKQRHKKS